MFIDCATSPPSKPIQADVCIVGSGPAALTLARVLTASDCKVVMIERGGLKPKKQDRDVHYSRQKYQGFTKGLSIGFGGTGILWGGQLLPMLKSEMSNLGPPWNNEAFQRELSTYYKTIESWVGVASSPFDNSCLEEIHAELATLEWCEFSPLFSKWIPFRRRNLGTAWSNLLKKTGNLTVLLNLQPTSWKLTTHELCEEIESVVCISGNHDYIEVRADQFIIAAGALETPLIIQEMLGKEYADKLGVGKKLHDHLSVRIAEVINYKHRELERLFCPFFESSTMRSLRLCLPRSGENEGAIGTPAYCHFVISAPKNSGFSSVRDLLRGLQARDLKTVFTALSRIPLSFGEIFRLIWMRYVSKTLSLATRSRVFVNLDFAQIPLSTNYIENSNNNGQKSVNITWDVGENIPNKVDAAIKALDLFWNTNGLTAIGQIKSITDQNDIENVYDIYHPAGTCATNNVVDSDLKIKGLANGYVLGSSVIPQLGRSNPTFTIMALSLRLASFLLSNLSKSRA
jgi:hypothetical protein